nr:reverse transcriptase domain-containing protein [Tanacetum cinerariifolium]
MAYSGGLLAGIHDLARGNHRDFAMPSHFHKKFRWGTVFKTRRKSFIEPGTGLRMKRTNHRTRVPIGLYPCHIEEKMTIKEVRGELIMEWKTKITTKEVTGNVNNANRGNGNGGNNGCSYKTFIAFNPKEFDGKGGVVALTCWMEKMELVFDNSGYIANQRVRYAASCFVNKALTWWNTQVYARGRKAAIAMPSHFHKKFRWGTVFKTRHKSFIEQGTGLRMKRTNHRTRVPIGLYPCHIEEKMTIKEVRGELVMEWKTKMTTKEVTGNVNNANRGNGNGGNNGCSYKTFTAFNPKEFDGKGGVVALTCWMEKMELVFDNSGYTANQRVRYAASCFVNKALTWWNTQVYARGRKAAIGMSWNDFKALLME